MQKIEGPDYSINQTIW